MVDDVITLVRLRSRSTIPTTVLIGITIIVLLATALVFATISAFWPRLSATLVLTWILPGVLLMMYLRPSNLDAITAGLVAVGLGWCWLVLLALLLHWLPGPIEQWPMIVTYALGAFVLAVALLWREDNVRLPAPVSRRLLVQTFLLLVVALTLRVPGLGSEREFYHDETFMLVRARDAVRGEEDALARHTKGPGEIAASLVVYRTLDTMNETSARLPFALMGVVAILATAEIGRRLFSPVVGLLAGVLLTVNGYALALSRIAQYQGALLLLMALALLTAWEFSRTSRARWSVLTIVFVSFGLIMHYELILALPAVLLLLWRGWQRSNDRTAIVRAGGTAVLATGTLVAVAYVSMISSSYFEQSTQSYYAARFGDPGSNNIPYFLDISMVYNSIYFVAGLLLLVVAGLIIGWRRHRDATLLLVLWCAPYFFVYLFVVPLPGTHFYMMMESWSLLAALPLAAIVATRRPIVRRSGIALTAGWLALSVGYLYLAFFRPWPEYLINFRETQHSLYPVPYETSFADTPRIGVPRHQGWKTLGVLREWWYFTNTYASNEEHTRWYLGDFDNVGFDDEPDFIFIAKHIMELNPEFDPDIVAQYQHVGEVRVRGERRIEILAREPLAASYAVYDAERFDRVFDTDVAILGEEPVPATIPLDVSLGDEITVETVGLRQDTWARDDTLHVILDWYPVRDLDHDYKLFVHVGADESGQPLTQWDGYPGLNTIRTSRVPTGETVRDHVLIEIPSDFPVGEHGVVAGFYDADTGERLGGMAVPLTAIAVR